MPLKCFFSCDFRFELTAHGVCLLLDVKLSLADFLRIFAQVDKVPPPLVKGRSRLGPGKGVDLTKSIPVVPEPISQGKVRNLRHLAVSTG